MLRPPTATPFPTRRSSDLDRGPPARDGRVDDDCLVETVARRGPRTRPVERHDRRRGRGPLAGRGLLDRQGYRDRKSTRLNSSHLVISYAVSCLKKKKTRYN